MGMPERVFSDEHLRQVTEFMDRNGIPPFRKATPEEHDRFVQLVRIVADVEDLKKTINESVPVGTEVTS